MNLTPLQDIPINIKFKLSALWCSVMFCYIYGDYFTFYLPGKVESFIEGKVMLDTPMKLFAGSVLMVVPSLMVFLSLALRPAANRWLNIIFGIVYTGIMLLIASVSLSEWNTFYVFLAIVESMVTSVIVWYAWNWPRS